jgi:pyridoxamine 5'-phosphate oxidase
MKLERTDYDSAPLDFEDLNRDPFSQFESWMEDAIAALSPEPDAFVLSTVGQDGAPSARTVLLKGVDSGGLVFYTNYQSRKGVELDHDARVAAVFLWLPIHRQVRVEGSAKKVDSSTSDAYFASRPPEARLASAASPQSRVVEGRHELDEMLASLTERYPEGDVPRPDHWGGYRIVPTMFEFWQGRRARFHDRFRYRLVGEDWLIERLAP